MAALLFDGNDRLSWTSLATALQNVSDGAWTMAILVRIQTTNNDGLSEGLSYLRAAGGTAQAGVSFRDIAGTTDDYKLFMDLPGSLITATQLNSTANPYLIVVSKGAGTVIPRAGWKLGSAGGWSHQDFNTTLADQAAASSLEIGSWEGSDFLNDAWVGAVAWWEGAMSDGNKEALGANWQTSDWADSAHGAPLFLVECNVAAGSLVDLIGNASSPSHTGTSLDSGETMDGWTFDGLGGGTAALTGTAAASITEADIVAGGKTVILTLTDAAYVPASQISDISFIANALGGTTTTTTFSITLPTTQAGDLLILEYGHRNTGEGTSIGGGTNGLTWTKKHSQLFATSAFSGHTWWARATGNHSGQTVTGSGLTDSCAAFVTQYRGAKSTGDPLADATVVGEQNASGNETQAEITTATNKAWVVLVVVNSPDLAISTQACTSPGTLPERAERLSTGGTDFSIAHASEAKATAGATGALTWAQTNAASGSWAYAITPETTTPFADARAAMRDGGDSAQSEAGGWDAKVKPNIPVANIVRTSDTVCTITLQAQADYDITAQEVITWTIPGSILTGGIPLVATPTFTIDPGSGAQTLTPTAASVTISAPAAAVLAGLVSLAAAACSVAVSAPTAPLAATVTLAPDAAPVAVSAPAATAVPGAATIAATAAPVAVSAPAAAIVPGAITIESTSAAVAVSAPSAAISSGFALTATAADVAVSAPAATLVPGTATIAATPASVAISAPEETVVAVVTLAPGAVSIAVSAPAATLVPGAVTIAATPASVAVSAPDALVDAGPANLTLQATSAPVAVSVPAAAVLSGAVTLAATSAALAVSAPAATLIPGTVQLAATPGQVQVSVPAPVVIPGAFTIPATAASVTLSAPAATVVPFNAFLADPAVVTLSVPAATVVVGTAILAPTAALVAISAPAAEIDGGFLAIHFSHEAWATPSVDDEAWRTPALANETWATPTIEGEAYFPFD